MESRRSLPNINVDTIAESTNIHANPQMKTASPELDVNHEETRGRGPCNDAAAVVRAVDVKIW